MSEHEQVVRDWRIPIPDELDKYSGIGVLRQGDDYVMTFRGTGQQLCILAVEMLRTAGKQDLVN